MDEMWMDIKCETEKLLMKYYVLEGYMGGSIFHYTSATALENLVRDRTLRVTKSDFLNDKTEYMYAIGLINEVFSRNKYKVKKEVFTEINREFKHYLARSFIFSASLNSDSVNLWSNYSDYEGYNIGLNLQEIFNRMWNREIYVAGNKTLKDGTIKKYFIERKDQHKSIMMSAGKVIYDRGEQETIISDIFIFLEQIIKIYDSHIKKDKDMDKAMLDDLDQNFNRAFKSAIQILISKIQLFKNPIFKQDEEYRIIFDVNSRLDVKKFRQLNGVFIPYIEVVFDTEDNAKGLPINSITIGPKNNIDIAEKGLKQFLRNQGYKLAKKDNLEDSNKLFVRQSAVPLRY
ncbi:DUF2971 domain-containing protein [Clostridium aminobutyricum]|uniref:DUF2971 domain-containing protein n=1 Tax=Clostridium aminobutyricum TaxID=33953 RepID=A0A939IKG6_CLOAM|nr:DUF2971 domain-containing protein [Clostridium aminobutyricum]MBN7774628.1 DUF2971 domain-containing protein [Clostridium aminobutyricum]